LDSDFADIRTYPPREFPGFVVLRLGRQDKAHVLAVLARVLRLLAEQAPEKELWIVEEDRVRIRKG
jgi:hypothetical protein